MKDFSKTKRITSVRDIPLEQEKDEFQIQRYIDGLVEFIRYSVSPLTIALQGEWGSGKTSLMNRLHKRLCIDSNDFKGININTWEYSMLSSPEETVIKIIEKLIKSLATGKEQQTAMEKFSKWAKLSGGMAFRAVREAAKIAGGAVGSILVESLIKGDSDLEKKMTEEVSLADLKKTLEDAIASHKKINKNGVLIFVDDLDRLNPPVAVEILELLKNIFSLKDCIFILAIDYEVVVKGLEPKFGKLTEKNEREFRSFFDKIIQVPFSLPVNNYHPELFIIEKLREINYIGNMKDIESFSKKINEIVNLTVGKNPRSIKRLINSISLINCITNADQSQAENKISQDPTGKLINFAVVAIQISYPRIYNLLNYQADYKDWDWDTARRFKAIIPSDSVSDSPTWEMVLNSICDTDPYLKSCESDIQEVIEFIYREIKENIREVREPGEILADFLKRSSITGVGGETRHSEISDYSKIYSAIHRKVKEIISTRHGDWKFKDRPRGKNGGFRMYPNEIKVETTLSPHNLNNNKITIRLTVPMLLHLDYFGNIKGILDAGPLNALDNESFSKLINEFDIVLQPLLQKDWFKGMTIRRRFSEQWQKDGKWLNDKRLLFDPTFDITVPYAEDFEKPEIIEAIADIHEALWKLYENAKHLR